LGLRIAGTTDATLGDGQTVEVPVCRAAVAWQGRMIPVIALVSDGGPFLGMAMLEGSRLTIDARENGLVSIEAFSS
jgi:predicted aspartyl protease